MSDSQGPIRIVDASGVYPRALNQSILEQKLIKQGRFLRASETDYFVFGSNEGGIHGAGAAHYAHHRHGAEWGVAFGPMGTSFAIPTKDAQIRRTLPLIEIEAYVRNFMRYASHHPEHTFQVTRIGCGLAGLADKDVAPMFASAPSNCIFDTAWIDHLPRTARYWGTF